MKKNINRSKGLSRLGAGGNVVATHPDKEDLLVPPILPVTPLVTRSQLDLIINSTESTKKKIGDTLPAFYLGNSNEDPLPDDGPTRDLRDIFGLGAAPPLAGSDDPKLVPSDDEDGINETLSDNDHSDDIFDDPGILPPVNDWKLSVLEVANCFKIRGSRRPAEQDTRLVSMVVEGINRLLSYNGYKFSFDSELVGDIGYMIDMNGSDPEVNQTKHPREEEAKDYLHIPIKSNPKPKTAPSKPEPSPIIKPSVSNKPPSPSPNGLVSIKMKMKYEDEDYVWNFDERPDILIAQLDISDAEKIKRILSRNYYMDTANLLCKVETGKIEFLQ